MEILLSAIKELILPLGVLMVLVRYYWSDKSIKDCFTITKLFIILNLIAEIIWHNKLLFPNWFTDSPYNLTIIVATGIIFYIWMHISLRWFTTENLPACQFCILSLLLLYCYNRLISSSNIAVTVGIIIIISLLQYMLLCFSQNNEEFHNISGRYAISTSFFIILALSALWILFPNNLDYQSISKTIYELSNIERFFVISGLLLPLLFMLGIAPLHFWMSDIIGPSVLPVASYFSYVPILTIWGIFIKINEVILADMSISLEKIYVLFGLVSIIVGAIGINTTRNLRKIFSSVGIYNMGVIMLIISSFSEQAVINGCFYILIYEICILEVYTIFYSLRSGGEYLSNLNMINGFFKTRGFLSIALFLISCSLMMIVPFPGFLSLWNFITSCMAENKVLLSCVVLICTITLIPAFMHICRAIFFSAKSTNFDRVDGHLYEVLGLGIILLIFIMLYPQLIYQGLKNIIIIGVQL